MLTNFRGTPWEPVPGRGDLEMGIRVRLPTESENYAAMPESEERRHGEQRMSITRRMIQRYGETKGCRGCAAIRRKAALAVAHDEPCRDRIMERIGEVGTDEGRDRMMRHVERELLMRKRPLEIPFRNHWERDMSRRRNQGMVVPRWDSPDSRRTRRSPKMWRWL